MDAHSPTRSSPQGPGLSLLDTAGCFAVFLGGVPALAPAGPSTARTVLTPHPEQLQPALARLQGGKRDSPRLQPAGVTSGGKRRPRTPINCFFPHKAEP